ncbi:MAG: arsenate reductase ArsC [Methanophagales archaeon ANME-1-THS]|nr:MAG: arsenate reductase ArsC [Methanophagales archaeon ANME-1-THS]
MKDKNRVLFICTHNSARSQMAEGLMNALYGDRYEAYSAGTEPSGVSPYAVAVMSELGLDISRHRAKHMNEFRGRGFEYVITLCDSAPEACPFFPGAKRYLHKGFDDPSGFTGTEAEKLAGFRRIRDEIRAWLEETFGREPEQV